MRCIVLTHQGAEDIAALEAREILSIEAIQKNSYIEIDCSVEQACIFAYKAQSIRRVLLAFSELTFDNFEEKILDMLADTDLSNLHNWMDLHDSFAVRCLQKDIDLPSQEIERLIGEGINEKAKKPVNLTNPSMTVGTIIHEKRCFIGVDVSGFDLSKRKYYLFTIPQALRGSVAYSLTRLSGWDGKTGVVLDPFSRSGQISIEAGLFASKKSPHFFNKFDFAFRKFDYFKEKNLDLFFADLDAQEKESDESEKKSLGSLKRKDAVGKDFEKNGLEGEDIEGEGLEEDLEQDLKGECLGVDGVQSDNVTTTIIGYDSLLRNVKAAQKNAKIAGIGKQVTFSRVELSWIDTKRKEHEVDYVVAYPPQLSQHKSEREIKAIYDELFYQLDYVLNPKGVLAILCVNEDLILQVAEKNGFNVVTKRQIYQGQQLFIVIILHKA